MEKTNVGDNITPTVYGFFTASDSIQIGDTICN